ncbi:MAG: DUF1566 domain-containing protein [Armatimonadota bacterium]
MKFTKLGVGGIELPDSAGWGDGLRMVIDHNTGLVWEVKSPEAGHVNDMERACSWSDAREAYPKSLNDANYGGFNDWRLPNKNELRTIMDYSRTTPAMDTRYFANCPVGFYWSADTYQMQPYFGWAIYNGFGSGIAISKASERYVLAVRGGYDQRFGEIDDSRFVDNADGTVTDTVSGLMWQQGENPRANLAEALKACEDMSLAGYTDWRLPNIKELNTILNLDYTGGWWYYKRFFPADGLQPPLLHYFSSTTFEQTYAWVTNFCFGYDGYYASKNATLLFRAVRNVEPLAQVDAIEKDVKPAIFVMPESGQRDDYDDEGNIISTPEMGEAFYGQDGQHISAPMSFKKLDDCTLDINTGLVWTTQEASQRFTWDEAREHVQGLNHLRRGGFTDWRLPNREELRSIISYSDNIPAIDTDHFQNVLPEFYWSSDTYAPDKKLAWGIYVAFGCAICYDKSLKFPAVAVRGGYNPSFGDSSVERLIDNGDGTISDPVAGLQWKQDESPLLPFVEALKYCESLDLAGHKDWHLPNMKEIATLIDLSYKDESWHHPKFFPNVITKPQGFYLASTTYAATFAWGVNFQFGYDGYYADKKNGRYPFRPVRLLNPHYSQDADTTSITGVAATLSRIMRVRGQSI